MRQQEHRVEVSRHEEAIAQAKREMGWRVYASNQGGVGLAAVVWGYRGQYHSEDDFSRLKGRPLSLTPLYLQEESRLRGLVLLLSLALRLLTLLEWQVRKKLQESEEKLKGIYPGRHTSRPTAEMLLKVFKGISLTVLEVAGQRSTHVTPLSPLQEKLLDWWDLPANLFQRLTLQTLHCEEPPSG